MSTSTSTLDKVHPIDPGVRERIRGCLADIEARHDVRVLFACESGSRGWGFASTDSDYDVRFIYVHPLPWYLRVRPERDVIELPIDDVLDVSGWELRKTLSLIGGGNATPAEWLDSPVVYREDADFARRLRAAMAATCQPERAFHHYLHMALRSWRQCSGRERVRLKRYFYVLRPLLAAQWIARNGTWPPMPFRALFDAMVSDADVRAAVDGLLLRKRRADEARDGEPIPVIDAWIAAQLEPLGERGAMVRSPPSDYAVLDRLLFDTVTRQA